MSDLVRVAAGVLVNELGQVLIAKRAVDVHQGGFWEFPGGKCETSEDAVDALARELKEEVGIEVEQCRPLIRVKHHYTDRSVQLDVYLVERWVGEALGREGQVIRWVESNTLDDFSFPEANKAIIKAIQLPDTYLITQPQIEDKAAFLKALGNALQRGVRIVQFRVFDLPEAERDQLLLDCKARCEANGASLLLNADIELAKSLGIDGLHLSSRQLYACEQRPVGISLLAASCHNLADLQQAERIGVDFAMLSPVMPTRSHPDAEPLGWEKFSEIVDLVNMPVFALGGMTADLLEDAWQAGAQGVAGIRGLW